MMTFVKIAAVATAVIAGYSSAAMAQTAKDLAGSWDLVSATIEQGDKQIDVFGPNPKGLLILGADGRFALLEIRSDLHPFAAESRAKGTPDENKAVVTGSLAYYGRYTVDEAGKSLTYHIEGSTYPNWIGSDQVRPFTLVGEEFTYVSPGSLGLGPAKVVWKRAH
jgi:hypothetical protein